LDKPERDEIEARLNGYVAHSKECRRYLKKGYACDVAAILGRATDLVVHARYPYEGKMATRRRTKIGIDEGVAQLIFALRDAILARRPAWKDHSRLAKKRGQ
jgi:hypothetical protein